MSSPSSCRRQQHRLQHQRSRTNEYASATNGNTNSHSRDDMKQHPVAEKRFVQKQRRLGQNSNVFASVTSSSSSSSKTKGENKKQKSRTTRAMARRTQTTRKEPFRCLFGKAGKALILSFSMRSMATSFVYCRRRRHET